MVESSGHGVVVEYPDTSEGCRWELVVRGWGTVAASDETFPHEYAAEDAVELIREVAADADVRTFDEATAMVHRYEVEKASLLPFVGPKTVVREGETRIVDGDGVDLTARTYDSADEAEAALDHMRSMAEDAELTEVVGAAFELFEDDEGEGWRLVDATGEVILAGDGRYDEESAVRDLVDAIARWGAAAEV